MNIELNKLKKLKKTLLLAAQACDDPVQVVEFEIHESCEVNEPHSTRIEVKFWGGLPYEVN